MNLKLCLIKIEKCYNNHVRFSRHRERAGYHLLVSNRLCHDCVFFFLNNIQKQKGNKEFEIMFLSIHPVNLHILYGAHMMFTFFLVLKRFSTM